MNWRLLTKWTRGVLILLFIGTLVGGLGMTAANAAEEEYVAIHALSSYPMFVDNDHVALKQFGDQYGVKVTIAGPVEWDMDAFAKAIEEVAARKPTGMLVYGFSPALKNAINNAVDAGIPVVTADADVADSKRFAFVGTDWYEVGVTHGREMARLTGGKGKVAAIMVVGMDIFDDCLQGYKDELKRYPDMEFVGVHDDKASVQEVARITSDILSAHPDIAGISGFDGASAGIGAALKEAGKAGKVMVTAQDVDPPQIKHLEQGTFHVCVGQKRKLFSYYGLKLLYDYVHSPIKITDNDKGMGIPNIPTVVNTGIFLVTPENVKTFKGE
jgi:ABC-type sugar transport system substrate-binding protein